MSVESGVIIKKLPSRVASTEITVGGKSLWVDTIKLHEDIHGRSNGYETLIFRLPGSMEDQVAYEIDYNKTHIPSEKEAIRNHRKAVTASVRSLRSSSPQVV